MKITALPMEIDPICTGIRLEENKNNKHRRLAPKGKGRFKIILISVFFSSIMMFSIFIKDLSSRFDHGLGNYGFTKDQVFFTYLVLAGFLMYFCFCCR